MRMEEQGGLRKILLCNANETLAIRKKSFYMRNKTHMGDYQKDYQNEIDTFKKNFSKFKDRKIVLYGIGRNTVTLLPAIKEFHVVGLMDRDEDNIGKEMYGVPILSKEEAEQQADLIIINTAETYWRIIYKRICELSIPIYFLNGEKAVAQTTDCSYRDDPYWQQTLDHLRETIYHSEVVSFDIFDTLIMRKVLMPQDVFKLVEKRVQLQMGLNIDFYQARLAVDLKCNDAYMLLDTVYMELNKKLQLEQEILEAIKQIEIETEMECCVPRRDMVALYNEVAAIKEVYLISDMYLPSEVISKILRTCGVEKTENLWISGEKKKNKKSGLLWKSYSEEIVRGRRAIHIGDSLHSDITIPRQYGIDTYYIMNSAAMWDKSSLGEFVPKIQGLEQSVFAGMLGTQIFNSPFALSTRRGMVYFEDFWQLGYCLLGGIVYSFLAWLLKETRARDIERIFFFARDGYFLEKDYRYLQGLCSGKDWPDAIYLAISRRLSVISSLGDENELDYIMNVPYNGTFEQFIESRFDIQIGKDDIHAGEEVSIPEDIEKVSEWLKPYLEKILMEIRKEKANYLAYISQFNINENDGVIDLWFYGKNQYSLSKVVGKPLTGFYFAANLSENNKCKGNNTMIPCFQNDADPGATECNLKKADIFIESFFTAPYGMIKAVDEMGDFKCAAAGMNQKYFNERDIINEGVCGFIRDYVGLMGQCAGLAPEFVDMFFENYNKGNMELGTKIKEIFYFDNAFIHRRESKVFD